MFVYKLSWTEFSDNPMIFVEGSRDEFLQSEKQYSQEEFKKVVEHIASTYNGSEAKPGIRAAVYNPREEAYEKFVYTVKQLKQNLGFEDFSGYNAEYEF